MDAGLPESLWCTGSSNRPTLWRRRIYSGYRATPWSESTIPRAACENGCLLSQRLRRSRNSERKILASVRFLVVGDDVDGSIDSALRHVKGSRNRCRKRLPRGSWESRTCCSARSARRCSAGYCGTFAWKHSITHFQALIEDAGTFHCQNSSGVGKWRYLLPVAAVALVAGAILVGPKLQTISRRLSPRLASRGINQISHLCLHRIPKRRKHRRAVKATGVTKSSTRRRGKADQPADASQPSESVPVTSNAPGRSAPVGTW